MLAERATTAGYRLITADSLASTNEAALERARADDPGRLWIRAVTQTQGRGRMGRPWTSPPGNLYASLLLIDPAPLRRIAEIGVVAGLALAWALGDLLGPRPPLRLKWPNDVLWNDAKCAGILVEGTQTPRGRFAIVLGFGVNCLSYPDGLAYPATCLSVFANPAPSAIEVLTALSDRLIDALQLWDAGANFAKVREDWLALALPAGSRLTVRTAAGIRHGIFNTIDTCGRLVIDTDAGPLTVEAADVFLTARSESTAV